MPTIEERLANLEEIFSLSKKGEDLDNLSITANSLDVLVYNPANRRIQKIPRKLDTLLGKGSFDGNADDLVEMIEAIDNPESNSNLKQVTDNGNETDNPIELIGDNLYLSVSNAAKNKSTSLLQDLINHISGNYSLAIKFPSLTKNSQQAFQDKSGVIALLEDIEGISERAPFNTFKFIQKGVGNENLELDQIGDIFCGFSNDRKIRYIEAVWLGGSQSDSDNFNPLAQVEL